MADDMAKNASPENPTDAGNTPSPEKSALAAADATAIDGALVPLPSDLVRYVVAPDAASSVRLDLSNSNVRLPILSTVCAYVALLNTPLVGLTLSRNALGPSGALLLGKALVTNNTLQSLELERCELIGNPYQPQHDGIKALAKGFESVRSTLQCINLADNSLQPEGCRILLGALSFHRTLTALDVSSNQLGVFNEKEGVLALSYTIRYAKQLRSLAISDNALPPASWRILEASLQANPTLVALRALRCHIPVEQLRAITHLTDLQG